MWNEKSTNHMKAIGQGYWINITLFDILAAYHEFDDFVDDIEFSTHSNISASPQRRWRRLTTRAPVTPPNRPSAGDTTAANRPSACYTAADVSTDHLSADDTAADRTTDSPAESQDPVLRVGAWVQLKTAFLNSVLPECICPD